MRGLLKAALLVAPALGSAHPVSPRDEALPHAFISLDASKVIEDVIIPNTLLQFNVLESDTSCNYGNITIDGYALAQGEDGAGSGSITTYHGITLSGDWKFSCVQLNDKQLFEQVLSFSIHNIEGYKVSNVGFTVQFQQKAPAGVSFIDGAFSVIRVPTLRLLQEDSGSVKSTPAPKLETELYELEVLRATLTKIEFQIAAKEALISQTFPEAVGTKSVADCEDVGCVVSAFYESFAGFFRKSHPQRPQRPQRPHGTFGSGFVNSTDLLDVSHVLQTQNHDGSDTVPPFYLKSNTTYTQQPSRPQSLLPSVEKLYTDPLTTFTIFGSAILIVAVVLFSIRAACTKKACERRRLRRDRRRVWREKREARVAAMKAKYGAFCNWLKALTTRRQLEDEEKDAAMRQDAHNGHEEHLILPPPPSDSIPTQAASRLSTSTTSEVPLAQEQQQEPDSDEDDRISTTMEQDLAHFRAVAGIVENLFTTGENGILSSIRGGGGRRRRQSRRIYTEPSSPTSTVPDYTSSDETLPTYEESSVDERAFTADGFQYTPDSSRYTPGSGSVSSLDENLEGKD